MSIRRIMAAALALLALGTAAVGESTMDELRAIRKSAEDAIAHIEAPTPSPEPSPTPEVTPTPTPVPFYAPLEQGARGEDVKRLQEKLAALGYLTGSVDGNYGPKTMAAVQSFQQASGLPVTGAADQATQAALFAIGTLGTASYEPLKYDRAVSDAVALMNARVELSGTVMQVLTDDTYADTRGVYTVLRVAMRQHAYDVVGVSLFRPADAKAIAEGDQVLVRGVFMGSRGYQSVSGQTIVVPWVEAEQVY